MTNNPIFLGDDRAGVAYALTAHLIWGVLPMYWLLLTEVPPLELTVHRIFWCALFVGAVTLVRGDMPRVLRAVRTPQTLALLVLSSLLIAANWTIYMYCVATHQLVEGSLGYYITPLILLALGFLFFGEKISRVRLFAIAIATVALAVQVVELGYIPWIAPSLAATFGLYGYLRKRVAVAALDGLLIETGLMLPLTAGALVWWGTIGTGVVPGLGADKVALLMLGGALTSFPLAFFAAGARRIRMSTMGFLQYLAPSITLLLAVFAVNEPFSLLDLAVFACVWMALALVALEGHLTRPLRPQPVDN